MGALKSNGGGAWREGVGRSKGTSGKGSEVGCLGGLEQTAHVEGEAQAHLMGSVA